tara:strand:- start:729 stop:1592 length:864 start_codon:yes stop_codon:yes gene_type:complete
MNILLVANKGKLHSALEKQISNYSDVYSYLINKNLDLFELIKGLKEITLKKNFNLFIFISGETRDENKMMLLNYLFPKEILRMAQSKSIPLIYLSSLSVFGIPNKNKVTCFSPRKSIDFYSTTKNLFDSFAKDNYSKASISCILPGSIINFKSKNDITNKLIEFFKIFPQNIIFKKIHPRGNISCVDVNDLSKSILFEINLLSKKNQSINFTSKICTINLSISKILKVVFKNKRNLLISNLPFLNSRIFYFIFNKIYLKKLVLLFNSIRYESNYKFNEEFYLNNFEK